MAVALFLSSMGAEWYAGPQGTPQGDGTRARPWDLATALADNSGPGAANRRVRPGDTLWLLGGTYRGSFVSRLAGAADRPIIVRNYGAQRVTLDHPGGRGLDVEGSHVWFWGLEITSSSPRRVSRHAGPWPPDIPQREGVFLRKPGGVKLINCLVHEGGDGLALWDPGVDAEVSGCLVYYVGWNAPDRTHGHGVYTQNSQGTKKLLGNIVFLNASHGLQAYGSGTASIDNFQIRDNVFFDNGELFGGLSGRNVLVGGGRGARNLSLIGNLLYRSPRNFNGLSSDLMLGYHSGMQQSEVRGNYVAGNLYLSGPFAAAEIADNTFYGELFSDDPARDVRAAYPHNTYLAARPQGVKTFVVPNAYEPGRGHIIIYNWDCRDAVDADVSPLGLRPGERYELRSAQDFYNDVSVGAYQGAAVRIPMTGHTVAAPVGAKAPASTFPEFGVFVMARQHVPSP